MACQLEIKLLTEIQKKTIREKLYLQPKKDYSMTKMFGHVETNPILFYWTEKIHITENKEVDKVEQTENKEVDKTVENKTENNKYIHLPYTFANTLVNQHINSALNFPASEFKFTGTLRDNQIIPVNTAWDQLNTYGTTTLKFCTGGGKSICSVFLSCELTKTCGGIILIVVNRETIQEGWRKTIIENSDAKLWIVDSKMKIPESCNIILTMDGKMSKIPLEIRKLVSVFVIDEAHLFCTKGNAGPNTLLSVWPKYVIACTATLERADGMESMILNIAGTHFSEMKLEKHFTVYKLNTEITTELVKNKMGTTDFGKLMQALAENPLRNALIIEVIELFPQNKIMLLSWKRSHVDLLYEILKKRGHSVDYLAGTKSKYKDSRILLGTISKISTGFDAQNVASEWDGMAIDTCILAGSTKSKNLHIQSIGRAFRSDTPTIIDLSDSDRITKSHWSARKKIYKSLNSTIIDTDIKKLHLVFS